MKKLLNDLLDVACEGAHRGTGFYVGADRLTALQYFAGVVSYPEATGTAPNIQRRAIIDRFMELARAERLGCKDVEKYLWQSSGGIAPGLYGH